jgi:hypothetical protein
MKRWDGTTRFESQSQALEDTRERRSMQAREAGEEKGV